MLILPNVTKNYSHGNNRSAEIMAFLNDNQKVFSRDLIGDLSHLHRRADSLSGIKIHTISHRGNNSYLLDFSFDWFAHTGCGHDLYEETTHQCISFNIGETGEIGFNLPSFEERSTFEEF